MTAISTATKSSAVLIGCGSGTIRNITITGSSYDGNKRAWYGGAIVGEMGDGTLENVTVTNCSLKPYAYTGLLCSTVSAGAVIKNISITDCQIDPSHSAWNYLVYTDYRPNDTEQAPSITDIAIDVEIKNVSDDQVSGGKVKIVPKRTVAANKPIYLDNIDIHAAYDSDDNIHVNVQENSIYVLDQRAAGIKGEVTGNDDEFIADLNGGTIDPSGDFVQGTLTPPVRDGYIFDGWYTNRDLTGDLIAAPQAGTYYYAKWFALDTPDIALIYQGTQTITAPAGVTFSNWVSNNSDVATVENGKVTAVGVGKTTIRATATSPNGCDSNVTFDVEVTPMPITFGNGNGESPSGTVDHVYDNMAPDYFDYAAFYPAKVDGGKVSIVPDSQEINLREGKDIVFVYDDGSGTGAQDHDLLPVNVTDSDGMNVTVKLLNPNYRFVTETDTTLSDTVPVTVKIHADNMDNQDLYINGKKMDVISGTSAKFYNGEGQAPISDLTSVLSEGINEFIVHFHPLNSNTDFEETHMTGAASDLTSEAILKIAPKEPGQYLMIINGLKEGKGNEKGGYAYASIVFSIDKATVTIRPNDKTMYIGDELPVLGADDYTITGLAPGDSLMTLPTLAYDGTPDTTKEGSYAIKASGATVNEEHYTLMYEDGVLLIAQHSENTDPDDPEGSGSTDDPGNSGSTNESGSNPVTSDKKTDKTDSLTASPQTGDTGHIAAWAVLFILSVASAVAAFLKKNME